MANLGDLSTARAAGKRRGPAEKVRRSSERASSKSSPSCPDQYTTDNGLEFDLFCGINIPDGELIEGTISVDTVEDCMEQCIIPRLDIDPCYGIAFNTDTNQCHLKAHNVTENPTTTGDSPSAKENSNFISGLANRDQMVPLGNDCPFPDGSIQTADNGEKFQIACFKDHYGADYHPAGWPWHADSLDECMELCSKASPLCSAVSWNPGMSFSFSNCFPKSNVSVGDDEGALETVSHMAFAVLPDIKDTCVNNAVMGTDAKKNFELQCDNGGSGKKIGKSHETSLGACVDTCATSDSDCDGVVFDSQMSSGYSNCVLYSSFSTSSSITGPGLISASLTDRSATPNKLAAASTHTSSAPSSSATAASSSSSSTNTWVIAGPIIGGLLFVLALAGGFFFWRRRNRRNAKFHELHGETNLSRSGSRDRTRQYPSNYPINGTTITYKDDAWTSHPPLSAVTPMTPYGSIPPWGTHPGTGGVPPMPSGAPVFVSTSEKDSWPIYQLPSPDDEQYTYAHKRPQHLDFVPEAQTIGKPHPALLRSEPPQRQYAVELEGSQGRISGDRERRSGDRGRRRPSGEGKESGLKRSLSRGRSVKSARSGSIGAGKSPDSKYGPWKV